MSARFGKAKVGPLAHAHEHAFKQDAERAQLHLLTTRKPQNFTLDYFAYSARSWKKNISVRASMWWRSVLWL